MPRACTVCTHPKRAEIDQALVNGDAYRAIACAHDIGRMALSRHRAHIGAALVEAAERQGQAEDALADDLLAQARKLNRDLRELAEQARKAENAGAFLQVCDRLQKQLALQATLLERAGNVPDGQVVYSWSHGEPHAPEVLPPEAASGGGTGAAAC